MDSKQKVSLSPHQWPWADFMLVLVTFSNKLHINHTKTEIYHYDQEQSLEHSDLYKEYALTCTRFSVSCTKELL